MSYQGLIAITSQSTEGFQFLISGHKELEMKLRQLTLDNPSITSIDKGNGLVDSNLVEYCEPEHAVTKGRAKRLKSSKEKATKGRLCKGCNKRGVSHNKRNCPVLLNRLADVDPCHSLDSNFGSRGSSDDETAQLLQLCREDAIKYPCKEEDIKTGIKLNLALYFYKFHMFEMN